MVGTIDHLNRELADNTELYEMSKADADFDGLAAIEAEAATLRETVDELRREGQRFGVLACVFALLPFGGAAVVWVPAALYLLATGSVGWAIFMLLWGMFGIIRLI